MVWCRYATRVCKTRVIWKVMKGVLMKKEYSLAHLTAISTTPLELAKIAANCGYDYVSIRQIYMGVANEVPVNLAEDKKCIKK